MKLVEPTTYYKASFREALQEFEEHGISGFWNAQGPVTDIGWYIKEAIRNSKGIHVPADWVPSSTYWLVDGKTFIGHVNIRHRLNYQLEKIGGHIGFFIRPSAQGMGYGKEILRLSLDKARKLGIASALITCDADNARSRKVIEKNGGILRDTIDAGERKVLRFQVKT